jgi:hypothetical protein
MSKNSNGIRRVAYGVVMMVMMATAAFAQNTGTTAQPDKLVSHIISTVVFGAIGIALAIIGFKLFDVVVKHNIENEIFDNKNMAAALLAGAIVLGVCMIISATILSP